ncbi:hypothetical protein O6H91_02G116500 [Diphasiastrum complanatum]|uniref:Uncharacterized protein n=1 Tax=Diphasiastrum complanatum TaxID=34168 RepID=A0ACC2EJQ1_DIPCM|nr:hypothetical protein O6H91_02G116500 [Diphasiastrum complanatum]
MQNTGRLWYLSTSRGSASSYMESQNKVFGYKWLRCRLQSASFSTTYFSIIAVTPSSPTTWQLCTGSEASIYTCQAIIGLHSKVFKGIKSKRTDRKQSLQQQTFCILNSKAKKMPNSRYMLSFLDGSPKQDGELLLVLHTINR